MKKTKVPVASRNGTSYSPESHEEFMTQLVEALELVRDGDFSVRLPSNWTGLEGKVADSLTLIATRMLRFNAGLSRLRHQVGEEGRINERLPMVDAVGSWAERVEAINALVDDLSRP